MSDKFPYNADAAGHGITLWEPSYWGMGKIAGRWHQKSVYFVLVYNRETLIEERKMRQEKNKEDEEEEEEEEEKK